MVYLIKKGLYFSTKTRKTVPNLHTDNTEKYFEFIKSYQKLENHNLVNF